jgi:hypothetical protein
MNLNEYPRITILPIPHPYDKNQRNVNRKLIECLAMLSRRDDDKEARLRAIDTSRGVSRYTVDQLFGRFENLQVYANNAAAIAAGLSAGDFYRTGADPDIVCVVH